MADVQLEHGFTRIANELLGALANAKIQGGGGLIMAVMLAVIRKTYGWQKKADYISYSQLAGLTRASRRSVIRAVKWCVENNLLIKRQGKTNLYKVNKDWETWKCGFRQDAKLWIKLWKNPKALKKDVTRGSGEDVTSKHEKVSPTKDIYKESIKEMKELKEFKKKFVENHTIH